jgi:hypothetical protein
MNDDARIPLPPPTAEDLDEAARLVLGEASEAPLGDDGARVFEGLKQFFIEAPGEIAGEWVGTAPRELQDRLMDLAARIRKAANEAERAELGSPSKNPLIKIG